jgi:hypothetical protein
MTVLPSYNHAVANLPQFDRQGTKRRRGVRYLIHRQKKGIGRSPAFSTCAA